MSVRLDTLNDDDRAFFQRFAHSRHPIVDPAEAVRALCVLQHVVSHNSVTSFPSVPADCICKDKPDFQNAGESVRFIIAATVTALDLAGSGHGRAPRLPFDDGEPF